MVKRYVPASFLLCMMILIFPICKVSATTTVVAISPPTSNVTVGMVFNVTVGVTNVANLTSWQLSLYYMNSVLNCSELVQGPFLESAGSAFSSLNITNNYNSSHGCLVAVCTLLGQNVSANGDGILATITFQALTEGETLLHLDDVKLTDESLPPQPIPCTAADGIVHSAGPGAIHDVAVNNATSYKKVVFQRYSSNFTVTVENQGGFLETFNVTLSALNATTTITVAKKAIINMRNGTSTLVNFTWDTTGLAKGNYVMNAAADAVSGETKIDNNNFTGSVVSVSIVGDLTGGSSNIWDFIPDGTVDGSDLIILARCYGSWPETPPPHKWNANCDINNDGVVDGSDLITVARYFGKNDL